MNKVHITPYIFHIYNYTLHLLFIHSILAHVCKLEVSMYNGYFMDSYCKPYFGLNIIQLNQKSDLDKVYSMNIEDNYFMD